MTGDQADKRRPARPQGFQKCQQPLRPLLGKIADGFLHIAGRRAATQPQTFDVAWDQGAPQIELILAPLSVNIYRVVAK